MLLLDAHIHVYPDYDLTRAWQALQAHADAIDAAADLGLVLVDREGQDHFARWSAAAPVGAERVEVADRTALRLTLTGGRGCWVFAGRQVAARERVEALGLLCRDAGPDGEPLAESLARIRDGGGLAVLAWGVGKWLLGRAAVVRESLATATPASLMLGDSALRPVGWGEPRPMRQARRDGFRVLAGSDPLPAAAESQVFGQYMNAIDVTIRTDAPSASLRDALANPAVELRPVGQRSGPRAFLRRMRGR